MSASRSEKPIGFSTSTGLPSCKALRIGCVCCCSGVETITAVTCGWLITSSLLALWTTVALLGGQRAGARGNAIGKRPEADRGGLCGQSRAPSDHAARAHHRHAHNDLLHSPP